MTCLNDLLHRLRSSLLWVAAQFLGMPLIVLAGLAWTRLPEKYPWQVVLSLLVPVLLIAAFLFLQAGTMRRLLNREDSRIRLGWGALILLAWAVVVWVAWLLLDWCSDQIPTWAGYLNSRAPAHWRASLFTYPHFTRWLALTVWVLRWIVVPGKVIPNAMASAQWGWRLPVRKLIRLLLNWRWWPAVVLAALAGVVLRGHIYIGLPHGTVRQQMWAVILKLSGSYLLVIASWVLLIAWAAVLLARQPEPAEDAVDQRLIQRLKKGRIWIAVLAGWFLLIALPVVVSGKLSGDAGSGSWLSLLQFFIIAPSLIFIQAGLLRSMVSAEEKQVWFIWGTLSTLVWSVLGVILAFLFKVPDIPSSLRIACLLLAPAVFIPIGALSAQRGFRLPWRRVLRLLRNWKWWAGMLAAILVGLALPLLLQPDPSHATYSSQGIPALRHIVSELLALASWILLMAWVAVLLDSSEPSAISPGEDALHVVPTGTIPLNSDSVKSPLPETGDGGRNA